MPIIGDGLPRPVSVQSEVEVSAVLLPGEKPGEVVLRFDDPARARNLWPPDWLEGAPTPLHVVFKPYSVEMHEPDSVVLSSVR